MANNILRQGAIRPILAAAPTGLAGVIFYDSALNKLKFHNASAFVEVADFGQLGSTTSGTSGATKLGGDNKTYANISGLSTYTVQDFFDRINLALAGVGGADFSDAAFQIHNASVITKLIKFDASAITAVNTRTLKMANADVDLAALTNSNIGAAAGIALDKLAATTATRVLVSDANGFVSASSTSPTTLGYLDVSSSVTTLLSGKVAKAGDTMTGALAMGVFKITSSYVPLVGDDLVNKTALDNAITGIAWIAPVAAFNLRGNKSIAGFNALSPVQGDQYLATDAGTPGAAVAATGVLDITSDITFTSVATGAARNTTTFTLEVDAPAANPTDTILFAFTGTSAAIVCTVTPNDGTNNSATPVTVTSAELRELVTTGAISGKNPTITDGSSFRALQTATGGGSEVLADAGEGDGAVATFSGGLNAVGSSDALAAGDIAEFNGTSWKKIVANSGGFAPAGTRVILGGSGASIASPYTDATDNDKLAIFSGASNTAAIQAGIVVDKTSLNVSDPGHISFYDNASFVYEGTPVTGAWVQFNGAGQIAAGVGLSKSGNTINANLGAGVIELPSDEIGIDVYATAPGLILTTDGTNPSTATGAKLRAYDIADANIKASAAIALNKLAATTATRVLVSDASGFVSASSTSPTTLGYLDVSSSLTTLLSGKEPTFSTLSIAKGGTNSATALNNGRVMSSVGGAIVEAAAITPSCALVSDGNGIPVASGVSTTTLGYLDISSSLTTLLSGKLANVVEDTSPQLGGDLDLNGKAFTGIARQGASVANSLETEYIHNAALTASTTAVFASLTFDTKANKSLAITYSAKNGNSRRTGHLMVSANNAATVASTVVDCFHDELDTTDLVLSWAVAMNGDNCEVSYTTGSGTYAVSMEVKRFKA